MVQIKTTVISLAALMASLANAATINTPTSITTCIPVRLTWAAAEGTVFLTIIPGGEPSAAPLENLGTFPAADNGYTWTPPTSLAGTAITVAITDGSGVPAYSDIVTVRQGQTQCESSAAGGAAAPAGSSAAAGPASSAGGAASSVAGAATGAASSAVAGASSAAAGASSAAASVASSARPAGSSSAAAAGASGSAAPASGASTLAVGSVLSLAAVAVAGLVM